MREYKPIQKTKQNLVGREFGRLTVIKLLGSYRNAHYWLCICTCGETAEVPTSRLNYGMTKSCGCLGKEAGKKNAKHGKSSSGAYKSWAHMMKRVYDESNDHYYRYGGRGLIVDEQFHDFENFYAYMGDRPKGHSIERADNDKGYVPGNMVWATSKEQSRNKSTNVTINIDGHNVVVSDAVKVLGVPRSTLVLRMKKGMTIEEITDTPRNAKRLIKLNGRITNLSNVSREYGIPYQWLWYRTHTLGRSIEEVVASYARDKEIADAV